MSKYFELVQRRGNKPELFHAPTRPVDILAAASCHPVALPEQESRQPVSKTSALPIHCPDWIREKARSWGEQVRNRDRHRRSDAQSIAREEEIKLVERVFPAGNHSSAQVVLFSAVEESAGCREIFTRASEILAARAEGPVCVVDAVFGSPSLHQYFGVENSKGLAEAVYESGPIQNFAHQLPHTNLWVLPAGIAVSQLSASLYADRLRSRMTELRAAFQYVLVHSSSLSMDPLSITLSHLTDGVVLVVEANSTRRERARQLKKSLDVAGVRVLGIVLNNRTFPIPEALYRRL
jgi:Mrp family chromosome partitioning ATPase